MKPFTHIWLPAILTALVVATGNAFVVECDVKLWYYEKSDPQRKPLHVRMVSESNRMYQMNFHFHDLFF